MIPGARREYCPPGVVGIRHDVKDTTQGYSR